jgi:pilus assembly protein Flp/PilA
MLRTYVAASNLTQSAIDKLRALRGDTSGVTAIEYGLIAGAIAVAIISTVVALGGDIKNLFAAVGSALNSAGGTN